MEDNFKEVTHSLCKARAHGSVSINGPPGVRQAGSQCNDQAADHQPTVVIGFLLGVTNLYLWSGPFSLWVHVTNQAVSRTTEVTSNNTTSYKWLPTSNPTLSLQPFVRGTGVVICQVSHLFWHPPSAEWRASTWLALVPALLLLSRQLHTRVTRRGLEE